MDRSPQPGGSPTRARARRARRGACRTLVAALLASAALTACHPSPSAPPTVLLFAGQGTSPNDVAALERILQDRHYVYATATSSRLDAMTESELRRYRLLVVPGGNFEQMGRGLAATTMARLRVAVGDGVNYFGVCAGAFLAGNSPDNGLNLTSGVRFPFYAAEGHGIRKMAVTITPAGSSSLDQYWEDGPHLSGWGEVVATYPDGTAAVAQGAYGKGWVVLTGVHPEAPDSWRGGLTFATPASVDNAYAATLIDAAATRTRLAHY